MATSTTNQRSGKHHSFLHKLIIYVNLFDPCNQLPHRHIILIYDIWLFNIHIPFFRMTITFDLLSWLLTSKNGNHIHDFIIFPTVCRDIREHISNHIYLSTFFIVHFNHIIQWKIFHSVWSHCSCCSNSHCTQVPQQNCACKVIVHDNVIIGGLHASRPSPMFSYSCRIESLPTYGRNWIQ